MSDCDRCQGEGMVITYEGRPLWMGPTLGVQRIQEIADGRFGAQLRACSELGKAARLLINCKGNRSVFMPTTCPDCGGEE